MTAAETSRFAPSTTGPAHPGTLLAALLCWLDARSRGARLLIRLEDLDPERCKPEWSRAMIDDLAWLGCDWDEVVVQSEAHGEHEAALDRLAEAGVLYACHCSRSQIRASARRAADGGYAYPGTCRGRGLPAGGWRASHEPLRIQLPDRQVEANDEAGEALAQNPYREMGDPLVRRRDGGIAYQLATVVDDGHAGVTRIVRGRDLAPSTATQVALQRLLGLPEPVYRHHLLLLEERGEKLAKFHGAVAAGELRRHYDGAALCGWLAAACGLRSRADPITPRELVQDFDWSRVRVQDRAVRWTGRKLALLENDPLAGITSRSDASPGTPTRRGKP